MPKTYRPREVIRVLESLRWSFRNQASTHVNMKKEGEANVVTVPISRRDIAKGTLRQILRKAGISLGEFEDRADEIL